jgi:hypothetical protein
MIAKEQEQDGVKLQEHIEKRALVFGRYPSFFNGVATPWWLNRQLVNHGKMSKKGSDKGVFRIYIRIS